MNWLTDLLKHLRVSRSVIGAIFVTTLVLYGGPKVRPSVFEGIPKEWGPYLLVALLLSGCLLFFWLWDAVKRRVWFEDTTWFHITPIEQSSGWSMGPRPDKLLAFQLKAQVEVQNRTSATLYFPRVKLLRPKILETLLHERMLVEGNNGQVGSADTGIGISAGGFRNATIEIAGTVEAEPPRGPMSVVFEVMDSIGNRQRFKMQLQYVGP